MTNSSQEPKHNEWSSIDFLKHEGFTLAAASVVMYVASFAWQSGYAKFFRIPSELVSVNLEIFLNIGALLIGIFVPMVYIYDLYSIYIRKKDPARPELKLRVTILVMAILLGIAVPLAFGAPVKAYVSWLLPAVTYLIFFIVIPLIIHRKGTLEERWAADDKTDKSFESLVKLFPRHIGLMILLSLVLTYVFHLSGQTWAMSKKEFLVLKMSNQVMLIKNGDNLLFASFDPKTRIVSNDFHVLSVSQLASEQFSLKNIGPLIPAEHNSEK